MIVTLVEAMLELLQRNEYDTANAIGHTLKKECENIEGDTLNEGLALANVTRREWAKRNNADWAKDYFPWTKEDAKRLYVMSMGLANEYSKLLHREADAARLREEAEHLKEVWGLEFSFKNYKCEIAI